MWQVKCESKCISLQTIVITFIMAKELITSNIIQNGILRCVEETLREEKEPKKRVRRRWFCKIASFKWPHGWSFSTLLCSRVPGQMGRWPAILDSRRASFEKEWSKKGIFWRWPHHFWLLRNSCKSRKGKMRYTNVRTRDQNVETTSLLLLKLFKTYFLDMHTVQKMLFMGKKSSFHDL